MANLKITQLTELTTPVLTDILPIVDNPTGTPITKKVSLLNLLNGWLGFGETITYVSATSFRIPGNYTSYFTKGTKMKCVNVTTKYGYVLSSTYSSPNTTVNLIANNDYSLVSGAITELKISYSNPPDFPGWFNFLPVMTGSTGTIGTYAESSTYAIFNIDNRLCTMQVRKQITNLGSWSGDVRISYPATTLGGIAPRIGSGGIYANAAAVSSPKAIVAISNGSFATFYKTTFSVLQWSDLATNDWVLLSVSLEV